MSPWLGILVVIGTVVLMEAVAYAVHRWVMHGPGWFLHKSHHEPRRGALEANDWYGLIFALPSIALFAVGGAWWWVGAGIAAYGLLYFGFHDLIVHKRIGHRWRPASRYLKRIIQAHRLHHVTETREGALSFGFLWAPRPERLKAELARRGRAGVRAPAEAASTSPRG